LNGLYLAAGLFLIAIASLIPPPGFSFMTSPSQDVPIIAVKTPSHAIEMGYPKTVYFYEPYVKKRWGYAYMQLINDSFKPEGLYDYERNRIISPEEVEAGLIIGYTGRVDMGFYSRVSWFKVLFMALGVGFIASAFLEGKPQENRILRQEAEMRV